ncbi:Glycosyl hydrolases family 28 [Pedobacter sp. ok626]|uniref:glycosyl hydrolase family 28 protein n=1 Tax=Pedobacter sp. ok626 TaxID=1761882 RepID=UPI000884586F|nr:glycosyl hydrolase family 28 protein [Pedobacter sp. ok626]SDK56425.1 Glycosyl hydrolases family 28 [Pedobacter sp. ok626]
MKILFLIMASVCLVSCHKAMLDEGVEMLNRKESSTLNALLSDSVTIYPIPSGLPAGYKSAAYTVTAGGKPVALYNAGNNGWGNAVSYGYFDRSGTVTVTVTPSTSFSSFKLLPESLGITGTRNGNTITFSIQQSANISLVLNNNYQGKVLHLFAEDLETEIPSPSDPNVVYYAPGYYDLSTQPPIGLSSGKTLYIAGGAVIRGRVKIDNVSNVTVRGRGILLNDYNSSTDNIALTLASVSNSTVRDIIVNRNIGSWTAAMHNCSFVNVNNYKAISPYFASSDGFNINSSHDITFDKAFVHSADDAVAIKGMSDQLPANSLPIYNITYKNAQLWADANNAIGIGAETRASRFQNILFQNIDVLYNFDDKNHPDVLPDRSAINIFALHGTYFSDITFENIRVENAKRLINIQMDETFYFGSLTGNWSWPGAMTNITYRNITSTSNGSNEIKLAGWDDSHRITGVKFENVKINGAYLLNFSDGRFTVNRFANGLQVISPLGTINGDVYNASGDFSAVQGKRNWYYRVWRAGIGTTLMNWNPDGSNHWRGPGSYDGIWNGTGNIYMHPDNSQAMLEWQAPKAGTVKVTGLVRKNDTGGGDGVNVSIWKNNTLVWPSGQWQTINYNNSTGFWHDINVVVAFGDVLSFRVDQRSNSGWDTTYWNPQVAYQ